MVQGTSSQIQQQHTKPLYIRIPNHLKARIEATAARLCISQTAITIQSLVKFLEEEEKIAEINSRR